MELKIDDKMQKKSYLHSYKMPEYILSLKQKSKKNIMFLVSATYCPVFEVKARINVLVPFDVINRSR